MSQVCPITQDEQEMSVSSEFEPRLTVLVGVGTKRPEVLTPDFRAEQTIKICGKLTVSF